MGKKKHLMGPAAGRIGKLVGDKLNAGDFATGASKQLKKSSDEIVQKVKRVSKRRKYLGSTPGKTSRTGREVIERIVGHSELVEAYVSVSDARVVEALAALGNALHIEG